MKTRIYLLLAIFALSVLGTACDKDDDPANQEPEVEQVMTDEQLQGIWELQKAELYEGDEVVHTLEKPNLYWGYFAYPETNLIELEWLIKFDNGNFSRMIVEEPYNEDVIDYDPDILDDPDNIEWQFTGHYTLDGDDAIFPVTGTTILTILEYNPNTQEMVVDFKRYQSGSLYGYDRIKKTFKRVD